MRAAPDASFMFEHGQCVIAVPVWASSSTSRSSSHTAWAITVDEPEDAALVHLLDRPAAELAQALLDLPDRLRRVGVDAGAELVRQRCGGPEHLGRAVEEVLEPDPRPHPPVGRDEVALEQTAVRLDRLEVVVPIGAVRRERRADADVVGGLAPSPP